MNRILACCLLLACLFSGRWTSSERMPAVSRSESAGAPLSVSAPSALLMEKETGTVLLEKNAHERLFPASVTKVMTMLLIVEDLDAGRVSLNDTVTASARAASFGGSCVYLEEGEQMSLSDMLKCVAVVSANDCAVALAEHLAGSEEAFVARMNRRAEELGLQDTHFTSCSGLFDDGEHYSSAYDLAVISRELLSHPIIKDYTTIWLDSIRNGAFELNNTNKLVYWYPGCTGLKTGYTSSAMYCLAASAERDGVEYIAVVLRCESIEKRNADAKALLNYAFAAYTLCPLRPEGGLPELPAEMSGEETLSLRVEGPAWALVEKSGQRPEYSFTLPESVTAPVREGEPLGTLRVTLGGETVAELPVTAARELPRLTTGELLGRLLAAAAGAQ
ncbi:MAG: D-alanyl-D-alanine carboxypeptidase [Oscillospiraceae bacterium]|nr:D-alanyl-D-alanine carboxypeptidase [Oscillospiraceae bacterium]